MDNVLTLLARLLIAQIFVLSGLSKLGDGYAATQTYMESMGTPAMLLPLVILLEVGGGLGLILGFLVRWLALALAGFSVVGAILFHHNFAEQTEMVMFMKDFAMAGGLLLLSVHGSGTFSLDAKNAKKSFPL